MNTSADVWRRAPDLAAVESPDRVVVVNLGSPAEGPRILVGTAVAVWEALVEPGTLEELVASVAEGYGLPAADIVDECAEFLDQLEQIGLARRTGPGP